MNSVCTPPTHVARAVRGAAGRVTVEDFDRPIAHLEKATDEQGLVHARYAVADAAPCRICWTRPAREPWVCLVAPRRVAGASQVLKS